MEWVLYLWLATAPSTMTPLDEYPTLRACAAARKLEVQSNIAAGRGGGIRYECMRKEIR